MTSLIYKRDFVRLPGHYPNSTLALKFSPTNNLLVTTGNDRAIRIWDYQKLEELKTIPAAHKYSAESIDISPDGKYLVTGGLDGDIKLWSLETFTLINKWIAHKDLIRDVRFYNNGKYLCSCSWDKYIKFWDLTEYRCMESYPAHSSWINTIDLSCATNEIPFMASAGESGEIKIWDLAFLSKGSPFTVISNKVGHKAAIFDLKFSPDGKYLASCSQDQTIILWDTKRFEKICTLHAFSVTRCIDFSPDSKYLIAGHLNKVVKLWSIRASQQYKETSLCIELINGSVDSFCEKDGVIYSIAFSPDGKCIAVGSMSDYLGLIPLHVPTTHDEVQNPISLL